MRWLLAWRGDVEKDANTAVKWFSGPVKLSSPEAWSGR